MVKVKDAFLTTDAFQFQIDSKGVVQLSFGPTHVCMSVDSAFDLQYRLAAFLAQLELGEYADAGSAGGDEDDDESEDRQQLLAESRDRLKELAQLAQHKPRKFDA